MLLNDFVAIALNENDATVRRAIRPTILTVDEAFLAAMAKLRNKSEKEVREHGAVVLSRANGNGISMYLDREIQGSKKDVYWPATLNTAASYLGTFHTHPYRERYNNNVVGIGFSNGDLAFYGQPHARPNTRNLALHLVFSNDILYLIIFWDDTSDTTDLGRGQGLDIDSCSAYVNSINLKPSDKKVRGELVKTVASRCRGNTQLFYAMQMYIDDYEGDGNSHLARQLESELVLYNYPDYPQWHMDRNIMMNKELAREFGYWFYRGICGSNPRHSNLELCV
jgi:hypothetical protein